MNRRRRTKAQTAQLEAQILDVLAEDHPQSVRHVFYRMTDPRLPEPVLKTEQGYAQVQNRITLLRREGRLPYGWITDATRRGYFVDTFSSAADFVRRVAGLYRGDLWAKSDSYVEVWCESRSIAGVIEQTCQDLAVSLYPAGGFSSLSLAYQAAEYINDATENGRKPAHVIYVGDYDPAGVLIDQCIDRELRQHLHSAVDMQFHRIAITEQQIEQYDLPMKPRKSGDKRALHIQETVEAEAMPAGQLRKMLRNTVQLFLPAGALQATIEAEESEREGLIALSRAMGDAW
jgi:hypothetical protein